ncbi:MAG: hypothetical protein LBR80_07250 [Deltaproteobacteria bacterium]|nr:hypothetical protein [Deltaproteobacteria bacterium]
MGYAERQKLFLECEALRGKPLIAYVTSTRPKAGGSMAEDAILPIIEQVKAVSEGSDIDFLIISNGGDALSALRIVDILRERFERISVLVAHVAFSSATLLALGADEIVMHPYSNLGPVDPQISVTKVNKKGQREHFSFTSEDIRHYLDFLRSDVGITDQAFLSSAFLSLADVIGPLALGTSKRAQQPSFSLSVKMLETHMEGDKERAVSIAKALTSKYFDHGYAVSRKEAEELGLNIAKQNPDLESIMWDIWVDYCNEMKCDRAFDRRSHGTHQQPPGKTVHFKY